MTHKSKLHYVVSMVALFVGGLSMQCRAHPEPSFPEGADLKFIEQFCPEAGEAYALAKKAAQYVRDNGEEAATTVFNKPDSEFSKNDNYVFAFDDQAVVLAHKSPELIGKNLINIRDFNGVPIFKLFTEIETEGWVTYKWPRQKASYIINVDGYRVGTGIYCE